MSIVNQHGRVVSSESFVRGATRGFNLPFQKPATKDLDELITTSDWKTLVSASRALYSNNGVCKAAVDLKAASAVGNSWFPSFQGADAEFGKRAEEWLRSFYRVCDVKGGLWDFQTSLHNDSVALDRDGDVFCHFVKSKSDFPLYQTIPAHMVGCRNGEEVVEEGRYTGLKIVNGVVKNRWGRAVAYKVLGETEDQDQYISARRMIHLFEPKWYEQSRGIPLLSFCITEMRSMMEANEREMFAMVLNSSLALVEYNEWGGPDPNNPNSLYGAADANGQSSATTTFSDGGMIKYFEAGSKARLENLENNRPSPEYQAYHDRLTRICLAGVGVPMAMIMEAEKQGTANRIALSRFNNTIADRQHLLEPYALKKLQYAVAMAIEKGDLPKNNEWYKWGFTKPSKRSTIDVMRESEQRRKDYDAGHRTLSDIVEEEGYQLQEFLRRKWLDKAEDERIRQEVEKETGISLTEEED